MEWKTVSKLQRLVSVSPFSHSQTVQLDLTSYFAYFLKPHLDRIKSRVRQDSSDKSSLNKITQIKKMCGSYETYADIALHTKTVAISCKQCSEWWENSTESMSK